MHLEQTPEQYKVSPDLGSNSVLALHSISPPASVRIGYQGGEQDRRHTDAVELYQTEWPTRQSRPPKDQSRRLFASGS